MGSSIWDCERYVPTEPAPGHARSIKPDNPADDEDVKAARGRAEGLATGEEPAGIQKDIADADKIARSGTTDEQVRNTPPAGEWNDTAPD